MAVHLAVAGNVFGGVLFCSVLFPHEMSWMRSGTELCQFLRIFQPTFVNLVMRSKITTEVPSRQRVSSGH